MLVGFWGSWPYVLPLTEVSPGKAAALSLLWGYLEIPPFLPPSALTLSSWAEEGEAIICFPVLPSRYLLSGSAERLRFGAH